MRSKLPAVRDDAEPPDTRDPFATCVKGLEVTACIVLHARSYRVTKDTAVLRRRHVHFMLKIAVTGSCRIAVEHKIWQEFSKYSESRSET